MLKGGEKIEREPHVGKARAKEALIGVLLELLGFVSNCANWDSVENFSPRGAKMLRNGFQMRDKFPLCNEKLRL